MKIRGRDFAQQGCFSRCDGGGKGFERKQMMNMLTFWFVLHGVPLVRVLGFLSCRYDRFLICDERLYGLQMNKPEWFTVAQFWITSKSVVVLRGEVHNLGYVIWMFLQVS